MVKHIMPFNNHIKSTLYKQQYRLRNKKISLSRGGVIIKTIKSFLKDNKRKGMGPRLILNLLEHGKKQGCTAIFVETMSFQA